MKPAFGMKFAALASAAWAAALGVSVAETPTRTEETTGLGELVITAQRRAESLQDAAVAVSAVRGDQLEDRAVTSVAQLTQIIPALNVDYAFSGFNVFSVRGVQGNQVNEFGDPAVAVYADGIYLPRPSSAQGLFYDVERIELLKGPQGTLYGRNSVAGALNVISRTPQFGVFGGYMSANVSEFGLADLSGAVNIPISENAAMRVALQIVDRDGYFSDGTGDEVRQSGRVSFLWEPSDAVRVDVRASFSHMGGKGSGETAICAPDPANPALAGCPPTGAFYGDPWTSVREQAPALFAPVFPYWTAWDAPFDPGPPDGFLASDPLGLEPFLSADNFGISAQIDFDLGGGTLSFIPTYRHERLNILATRGAYLPERNRTEQETVELRYSSNEDQFLSYIAGIYYSNDEHPGAAIYDGQGLGNPFGAPAGSVQYQTNRVNSGTSYAGFLTTTLNLTDTFHITAGARYTHDEKEINATNGAVPYFQATYYPSRDDLLNVQVPVVSGPGPLVGPNGYLVFISPFLGPLQGTESVYTMNSEATWNSTDWKAGLEWDIAEDSLLYLTVATGYKAGGFYFAPPGVNNTYDPESLTAYTLGSKNRFLNNALQLNLEVFYWKYEDQQVGSVRFLDPAGAFVGLPLGNADQATIKGAELELEYLASENTRLSLNAQYQEGVYDQFQPLFADFNPQPQCTALTADTPAADNILYDCSGLPLLNQPQWIVTAGVQQTFPLAGGGEFVADLNGRYEDSKLLGYAPFQEIGANTVLNFSLAYRAPEDTWSIQAYVNNLTDEIVISQLEAAFNSAHVYTASVRPPRTIGLRLTKNF